MLEKLRAETGWIWSRCRHRLRSALALSLAFKALDLLLSRAAGRGDSPRLPAAVGSSIRRQL